MAAILDDDLVLEHYPLSIGLELSEPDLRRDLRQLHDAGLIRISGITLPEPAEKPLDALAVHVKRDSTVLLWLINAIAKWSILKRRPLEYPILAAAVLVLLWFAMTVDPTRLALSAAQLPVWGGFFILPVTFLLVLWHEAGHASAMKRLGRVPLRAGVGVYLFSVVLYVELSTVISEPATHRRRVDMAGLAHEAALIALIVVSARVVGGDVVADIALGFGVSALLFSFNPWIHSDLSWLLTDFWKHFDRSFWLHHPAEFLRTLRGGSVSVVARPPVRAVRTQALLGVAWMILAALWALKLAAGLHEAGQQREDLLWHLMLLGGSAVIAVIGIGATLSAVLRRKS
ncbi:hypothetical protein [Paenarthrobacter sp. NPDC089316]|uniref:hypothetical protein n=1 Tax=unclassified Paenarthrobacter TaxID=2634190 RepID=UPI003422F0D5